MKIFCSCWLFILLFLKVTLCGAALISTGNGTVFDNASNLFWFQDLSVWGNQTMPEQQSGISQLNIGLSGYADSRWGDWRMATGTDMWALWSENSDIEIFNSFTPTRENDRTTLIRGRYDEVYLPAELLQYEEFDQVSQMFVYKNKLTGEYVKSGVWVDVQSSNLKMTEIGAWVVADANHAEIPEPASVLLLGIGLICLLPVFVSKRRFDE